MGGKKHNKLYNPTGDKACMRPSPEDSNRTGREALKAIRRTEEERWEELAEETALTKRQIAIWELAVLYDLKQRYIASEYGIKETTVSRHVERVREKADHSEEKINELKAELQKWKETQEYLNI